MRRWWERTFVSMRDGPFRVLWLGTFLSFLGFSMSAAAQSVVAYDLAGNNRAVGTVMFGQGIAMLVLSPAAGALADRAPRGLLLVACQAALGLTYGSIALMLATDVLTIPLLATAAFVVGTVFAVVRPARNALLGEMVAPDMRGNAVAVTELGVNATRIGGPFLAGWLLAVDGIGATGTYALIFAIFVLVVGALSRLPAKDARAANPRGFMTEVVGGLTYVWRDPRLRWVIGGMLGVTMLGFPYLVVLPRFNAEVLDRGTASFGTLLGVAALGGLVASALAASIAGTSRASPLMVAMAVAFGVGLAALALSPNYATALAAMFAIGAGMNGFITVNNALALQISQPEYFGRVISFNMMALSANGVIGLPLGLLADQIGERAALWLLAAGVSGMAVVLVAWKRFARVDTAP